MDSDPFFGLDLTFGEPIEFTPGVLTEEILEEGARRSLEICPPQPYALSPAEFAWWVREGIIDENGYFLK